MGNSYDVGLAIIKAHKEGIVTSASVMPTSPFFYEAVKLCNANLSLAAGIHITLLGTRIPPALPPEEVPSLVTPEGFIKKLLISWKMQNPILKKWKRRSGLR